MSQTQLSFRAPTPPGGNRRQPPVLTVSQVVRAANRELQSRLSNIWVEGEVSNVRVGAAGHAFFTLKDDDAALPVAMWKSSLERLRFRLQDGQSLRAFGRLGIYAKQGRFQLYADRAEPAGMGALMLELEQRKAKLAAEGLFDPKRRRPLPAWPRAIGVVTSAHGAAIHDIVEVARRRCPSHIILASAVVQGPDAPRSLCRALARLDRSPKIDVVIIGRGGGSVEDLWAFNDEALARMVAAFRVPVVSAVGHEVDVSICDLVSDVRAATPSHAAELVVPDRQAFVERRVALRARLQRAMERILLDERTRYEHAKVALTQVGRSATAGKRVQLQRLGERLARVHPRAAIAEDRRQLESLVKRLRARGQALPGSGKTRLGRLEVRLRDRGQVLPKAARARLDGLSARLAAQGHVLTRDARTRLARCAGALDAMSPLRVLERGYAVVADPAGKVVTRADQVEVGTDLSVRLGQGKLAAKVTRVETQTPQE